jgi:hypothetical protein
MAVTGHLTVMLAGAIMKLLPLFLVGFGAGLAACWAYIGSLKTTIKLYEAYIHQRIDTLSKGGQSNERPAPASSHESDPHVVGS